MCVTVHARARVCACVCVCVINKSFREHFSLIMEVLKNVPVDGTVDGTLLDTQHYKIRIKGKVEQSVS